MIAIKVNNLSMKFKLYSSAGKRALEYLTMGKVKGHTEFWALQDISFEVPKGTTMGIIGQNGSGKSTLLSILAGVLPQSIGDYEVNGKVSAILELGSGFHPEFTGRDNVYMYGSIMGLSKEEIDEKFNEILHFSELDDFIDQPLRTYSSGMIVRLAFSVAVNVNCDILIVDEALAVGDAIFQHRCFRKIHEMQEEGKTILYVGHDTEVVRSLCNYAMLLDKGRIIERGDANTVVNKYQALIVEREKNYNERNIEDKGEILRNGYETVYNFIDNLKRAKKKSMQPDYIREQMVEIKSLPRKVIFAHPPSTIEYDLKVEKGYSLSFAIGLLSEALDKINQGIKFDINIKYDGIEKNIFSRTIEPNKNQDDRNWNHFKIGLEEFYGKDVLIKFITSGTSGDFNYCWAAWGWPKLIRVFNDFEIAGQNISPMNIKKYDENLGESETAVEYGNNKAEILKLELLDSNGMPKLTFDSGELAIIKVHIRLNEDIESNLAVGYIIKNKFIDVYGMNTRMYGLTIGKKNKGDILILKFKQYLKLGSGLYSLNCGVFIVHSNNETEFLDRRIDWLFFKIFSRKTMHGIVDLDAEIEECHK